MAPIVSGKANLTIPTTLEDGVYNLTASHAGDDKYYPSSNSTLFSVFDERVDGFVNVSVVDGVAYFVLPVDAMLKVMLLLILMVQSIWCRLLMVRLISLFRVV